MQLLASLSILAVAALAAPTQRTTFGLRSIDACAAAENCETYMHPDTNTTAVRFKRGMSPASEWYHQNVRVRDAHHPMNKAKRGLFRRDDTVYNSDRSTETENFGDTNPVDVVNAMYTNCGTSGCDGVTWTQDTNLLDADGTSVTKATISVAGFGEWDESDPNNRGYFIDALKAQSDPSSEQDNVLVTWDAYTSDDTYENFYVGTNYVNINRYVGANLQGYAAIKITVQSDTADACSVVTSILSAAVGTVTGIGGAFFGIAGDLTCNLASS